MKPKIRELYGDRGSYCFQVGMDLSNLMFAAGLLSKDLFSPSHFNDIQFLSGFLENLRHSVMAIGNPEFMVKFISKSQKSLSDPAKVANLSDLSERISNIAQDLSLWIEGNVSTRI